MNIFRLSALIILSAAYSFGNNAASNAAPPRSNLRLDGILWHEVKNHEGVTLGTVSDVLVQMPSGRVVYVAVVPGEPFQRPKAVPPGAIALGSAGRETLQLNLPINRWINAPVLDWDSALVIKNANEGREIYGYYQQAWKEPDRTPPWGIAVTAPPVGAPPPERYVSLKKLLWNRVATSAMQHVGFIDDFLIDWVRQRATHALISSRVAPLKLPETAWLAVPVPLLQPPVEYDLVTVNTHSEALQQAELLPANASVPSGDAARIFRYPVAPQQ